MTGDKILPVNSHELEKKLILNPFEDEVDKVDEEEDINNTPDCCRIISCVYLYCLLVVTIILAFQSDDN